VIGVLLSMRLVEPVPPASGPVAEDLAAARRLFEANLDAIRRKDRDGYLACYLRSDRLARTGPGGFLLGYAELEKTTGSAWPDLFEGRDLQLVPVGPGLVYGTYRYRVRYGDEERQGLSERLFVRTPEGWRIAITSAFDAPAGTPPPPLALVGATLVPGTGAPALPDSVVLVRGGRIDCAGSRLACPVPEGVDLRDLSGHWITPGLVDAHVHFSQSGWADGRPDALDVRDLHPYEAVQARLRSKPEAFFRSYLCSGVTAVFDVGGYPWTWSLRDRAEADTRAPHVAAAGPLLSTLDFWLNLPGERQFVYLADPEAARAGVRYLAAQHSDAAKVWLIPEPADRFEDMERAVLAAGDEARQRALPLIVHATGLREAKVALRAGARLLVHSVWDQPVDEEFLRLARESGTVYCPTLTVLEGYRRLFEAAAAGQAPAVADPGECVDRETLERIASTAKLGRDRVDTGRLQRLASQLVERRRQMAENLRRVRDAGIPIAMGTDAGNPLTLPGPSVFGEMEAMQAAGLTPMEVLVAATRGGALAMGRDGELGSVEQGKLADLLVVAADPTSDIANLRRVRHVVRAGVMRAVEELRPAPPSPSGLNR
jgi:imidazolonepropionase-like amidohydrolase